ncbi:MAG TPA: hypothetical protein VKT80_15885, partial [Chloroflexota bacterium]|nr:hypothetical protein [Chloroflexota bacterium]
AIGSTISGAGITAGTTIASQLTGTTGGVGTYRLSTSQQVASEAVTSPLDASSVVTTGGSVKVSATDSSKLTATSTITLSSTAGAGGVAGALSGDYSYTEQSGTQKINKGDKVRVQTGTGNSATAIVYTYQGANGTSLDLSESAQTYATNSEWKAGDNGSASTDSSAAESKAIGFNFVLNDVRAGAEATIAVAPGSTAGTGLITGGTGVSVTSNEAATITADTESNLTSTGGGNGSQSSTGGSKAPDANTTDDAANQPTDGTSTTTPGGGLALGGAVVTNLVLAQSQASIQDATLSAGSGGIVVDAQDTAQLNATTLVASSTGGAGSQKDFDLSIAFNSIGYAPENILFNAVDALIGGDYLSNPTPDNATAYVSHVSVSQDLGDLSVTAESNEQVNATVSNAASSTTSALYDASSTGFGGVLASNKVSGSAIAFIDETGVANPIDITGALTVSATDGSGIYSNVKLVSAAIVTSDGGTGPFNTGLTTPPTFTALGATPSGFNNPQDLVTGNTVMLDATYDTPTYTVGAAGQARVNLQTGDVVDDGGTLYRYTGSGANGFALTHLHITGDPTNFVTIGGTSGDTYTYIGSGASQVDLANTDYSDAANWKLVPNNFTALASGNAPFSNPQTVNFGDMVTLDPGYATPDFTVGAVGESSVNLRAGDVVQDGSTLYRYGGANANSFVLTDANIQAAIQGNPSSFTAIGGESGATYQYMGSSANGTSIDLANTDYTNLGFWKAVTTNAAPAGVKTVAGSTETGGAENEGAATNDSTSTAKPSNATAVGGILVLNDDRSATHAYILDATISADTATVSAIDKATIDATNDSTVTAGSSSLGSQSNNIA